MPPDDHAPKPSGPRLLRDAGRAIDLSYERQKRTPTLPFVIGTDIPLESPMFFWSERIPLGELCLLDGEPMEGKSTLAIGLAARVSNGSAMPFDDINREPGTVIWFGPEEDTRKAAMPRFVAADGDRSRFVEI